MAERYSRSLLRIAVAHICQNLGWNAIQSTPIELLTDILERYLVNVGCTVHEYAEQFGRTEPNLNDVGLAFHNLGINLTELADYVDHVEPAAISTDLPKFPATRPSQLSFPSRNSREVKEREEHIHDHLPPMFPPSKEEESPEKFHINGNNREGVMQVVSPMAPMAPMAAEKRAMSSPVDLTPPPAKRSRILPEEAAHSQYEMKGVMMTTTGFLTPTRGQGKLPDSRTPPPPTPGTQSISINLNPLLTAPDSPPIDGAPAAEVTETVVEQTVEEDDPDFVPDNNDSLSLSLSGGKTPKAKDSAKKGGRPRGRGKGRAGRSPKQGQSPGRGRSPKGSTKAAPEPKTRELLPESSVASVSSVQSPADPMEESPESPKLMIDEEKGLQKEASEAREKRLAAYDNTIDDVIKRVMSQQDGEEEEEEEVKPVVEFPERSPVFPSQEESLTSLIHPPPPPIDENEEDRQRRRSYEVQQELEHIQERKKEWEKQERQRIEKIEREIRIDDTINDVIRNAGVNSDDDHRPTYAEPVEPTAVPSLPMMSPLPQKEPNVFDFEEDDFSPPAIPDIPMSPQREEPPTEVVVTPKEKPVKRKRGRPAKSPGSNQKVKDKLKKKLQKQPEEEEIIVDWPPKDEPLDLTGHAPVKEEPAKEPVPEKALAAEAMKPELSPPLVQPLKIKISQSLSGEKALKEEKEHSSKKEKKKKKNKDKDKDKDKDKNKEKKKDKKDKDKKDKEKKKDKHEKEKKEKEKESDTGLSVPKLTLRIGGKKEVSVEAEPPKPDLVPKLVLKKPTETPPPGRVPTKAAMKLAPIANIPPPAPVLRQPTPSPPSSPSPPPSPPPMEARLATPPPPSKFMSPPPPAAKAREITPPPPPSSSLRSKANPTPVLTVETIGADAPARAVYTETVGSFYDDNGDKVWICPACKMQDDGSPMVGCDDCDDWYHYPCVGIINDPPENEQWYCPRCNARRIKEAASSSSSSGRGGRGRKKRKKKP